MTSHSHELPLTGSALHLLHRAGQRADELFAATMGENELTPRQFAVLKAVARSDNPSQTDLVQGTGIDRSTLADIVRRLIRKGLLQRRRTSHDARMYAVKLTPSGRDLLDAAEPAARFTEEQLLSVLPSQQRSAIIEALSTIVVKLEAAGSENGNGNGNGAEPIAKRRRARTR
ncbi:MAG: MarR family transcriptional regulator [Hyphomicrobiaceae bacterium]|nr:MarR family transcriptional regulator [Hyphomicrobiaceae bacterium]